MSVIRGHPPVPASCRERLRWALLLAVALSAPTTVSAQASPVCTRCDALTAEVTAFLDDYLATLAAGDTARLRTLYVADDRFAWVERGQVQYRSVAGVFAGLAQMPPGTRIHTELKDLEVMGVGSTGAIARTAFTTTIGEGGGAFTFGGLMTMVLERADGHWRILTGHVSEGT